MLSSGACCLERIYSRSIIERCALRPWAGRSPRGDRRRRADVRGLHGATHFMESVGVHHRDAPFRRASRNCSDVPFRSVQLFTRTVD